MARQKQSRGRCAYCGGSFAGSGMSRHLQSCAARRETIAAADGGKRKEGTFLHLVVRDAWAGRYWLHLEMDGAATLRKLDEYLRAIWLECCGHLSEFSTGGWRGKKLGMTRKVGDMLRPGEEVVHIYDFGTSSETLVSAVEAREGRAASRHPIALMARNETPSASCMECGKDAAFLCTECIHEHDQSGALCAEHARTHPHDDYGEPIPLVNSPRLGLCGYTGPAEPPY